MENDHPGCLFADFTKAPARKKNSPSEPELGSEKFLKAEDFAQILVWSSQTMIFHEQI